MRSAVGFANVPLLSLLEIVLKNKQTNYSNDLMTLVNYLKVANDNVSECLQNDTISVGPVSPSYNDDDDKDHGADYDDEDANDVNDYDNNDDDDTLVL